MLSSTKVLIKASISFCLLDLIVLPCQPAFGNYTYCFHESFGFWKNKVGCLSNNWGLSKQLIIAESQCSCNTAYSH